MLNGYGEVKNEFAVNDYAPPAPERPAGAPRKMTGFLATLTPEQRERALAYRGEDIIGDASMAMEKVKA